MTNVNIRDYRNLRIILTYVFLPMHYANDKMVLIISINIHNIRSNAVSYTHLDVYKRQVHTHTHTHTHVSHLSPKHSSQMFCNILLLFKIPNFYLLMSCVLLKLRTSGTYYKITTLRDVFY